MDDQSNGTVTTEVENRLDDLFNDAQQGPSEFSEQGKDIENSPLKKLKATVLSIDWEITDEIMTEFIDEIESLKGNYQEDKILILFLQLLSSVGKYIRTNKADAHPDSIKVLNSVYNSLEKVILSDDVNESEKKKILFTEVNKFKQLKEDIGIKKAQKEKEVEPVAAFEPAPAEAARETTAFEETAPPQEPAAPKEAPSEAPSAAELAHATPHEAFIYALEEIKEVIKSEFRALRAELKLWRDSR